MELSCSKYRLRSVSSRSVGLTSVYVECSNFVVMLFFCGLEIIL